MTATLYRFQIELSDVDRGVYETLDFRAAQHPSETLTYLLTRVLAFALNAQDGLEFSPGGLSDPDEPALRAGDGPHETRLWIEIGNPSAKKLHRAAKRSRQVRVYTYKDPDVLVADLRSNKVYGIERIEIFSLPTPFLERLAKTIDRKNSWNLLVSDGNLTLTVGEFSETTDLSSHVV